MIQLCTSVLWSNHCGKTVPSKNPELELAPRDAHSVHLARQKHKQTPSDYMMLCSPKTEGECMECLKHSSLFMLCSCWWLLGGGTYLAP